MLQRIASIGLIIILVVLIVPMSSTEGIPRYTAFYTGLENTARYVTFPYEDALLFEKERYSSSLALASMALSAAAYSGDNVAALMPQMGFVHTKLFDYRLSSVNDNDFVAASMGYKKIIRDGKAWDLFLIAVRGTHGSYDWLSNFHFGDGEGDHAGFSQAMYVLMGHFRDYLKSLQTEGYSPVEGGTEHVDNDRSNNLIWIMGHSRGGAVANLLAAELAASSYVNNGNLCCYTFASPCVTSKPAVGDRRGFYNFINPGDFVTTVPLAQWGFVRYGKTIRLSDNPSWEAEMQNGFTKRTGWYYQGASEAENAELIGMVQKLAPTVDDNYHKNYGLTLSQTILSRLTKALGVPFTPQVTCVANLFEGVAFAMAKDWLPAAGLGAVQAIQDNDYVNLLLRLFNSSKIEQGIPHAHSLESYLSWMAALASDTKAPSDPGLPAYLLSLEVTGGTLSPAFEPGVTEYTVTVPTGNGKVSVSSEPASWYDLDAQESGKGRVVLEFRSDALGIQTREQTKVDLVIPEEGADLSLNVLTWETAEQTKYALHFLIEKTPPVTLEDPIPPIPPDIQPTKPERFKAVYFGRFMMNNNWGNYEESKSALKWRILAAEGDRILMITDTVITHEKFHDEDIAVTWKNCSLREWLNSDFINNTFSSEEQKYILATKLITEESTEQNRGSSFETEDKAFLLNIQEAKRYFENNEARSSFTTPYANTFLLGIELGVNRSEIHHEAWLLRSPGQNNRTIAYVDEAGSIVLSGIYIYNDWTYYSPIRPAIWVKADAPCFQ